MILKLIKSRAVKPDLIRCTIEVHGDENNADRVTSEYELIVDTGDFVEMKVDQGITEMMINIPLLQEQLTIQISQITLTGGVAAALNSNPLVWTVIEAPNDTVSNS